MHAQNEKVRLDNDTAFGQFPFDRGFANKNQMTFKRGDEPWCAKSWSIVLPHYLVAVDLERNGRRKQNCLAAKMKG